MQEELNSSYVKDELLVGFSDDVRDERRDEIHEERGSTVLLRYALIPADHVRLAKDYSVDQAIEDYQAYTNEVDYAEPVYVVHTMGGGEDGGEESIDAE